MLAMNEDHKVLAEKIYWQNGTSLNQIRKKCPYIILKKMNVQTWAG